MRQTFSKVRGVQMSCYPCTEILPTTANQRELVTDLIVKAKQVDYLINSLPEPEPELPSTAMAAQVSNLALVALDMGRPKAPKPV